MILGIDEVGRGCWAGPLCVGAVVLGDNMDKTGLADSKTLSAKKREELAARIKRDSAAVGVGWASARVIDSHGLTKALEFATRQAVAQIATTYNEIILDGTVNFLKPREVTLLKKADQLIPAVSAASIIAKVARDSYMTAIDHRFPDYEFAKHVGYGTKAHRRALDLYGPTTIHRMSFSPLATFKKEPASKQESAGAKAERIATEFLTSRGFTLLDRNWRTRWCEIDIIATKEDIVSFVEVKYRKSASAGHGLEYITVQKQRQMTFAAELWLGKNPKWRNAQLAAIELEGKTFEVTNFVERVM